MRDMAMTPPGGAVHQRALASGRVGAGTGSSRNASSSIAKTSTTRPSVSFRASCPGRFRWWSPQGALFFGGRAHRPPARRLACLRRRRRSRILARHADLREPDPLAAAVASDHADQDGLGARTRGVGQDASRHRAERRHVEVSGLAPPQVAVIGYRARRTLRASASGPGSAPAAPPAKRRCRSPSRRRRP